MKAFFVSLLIVLCAASAFADILVPTRTIRPNTILMAQDFVMQSGDVPGAIRNLGELAGMETKVALYPGRPVRHGDVGPPAIVERNGKVTLVFSTGAMEILAEGRALGRGGVGDDIRVMNTSSRSTVFGTVLADGRVRVNR